jgi:hypothetical protein
MKKNLVVILVRFVLTTVAIGSLTACDFPDSQTMKAIEIIKKNLRDPSSFSYVNGKTVWSGENAAGNPAYVVRVEYDANNAFGGTVRECKFVAFFEKGGSYYWRDRGSIDRCDGAGMFSEEQMVEVMSSTLQSLGGE